MRMRSLAFVIIALAFIVFSAACKPGTGNTNNANRSNSNGTPAPLPTTSNNAGSSTPTETFKTFYTAIKNKDIAAFKSVLQKKDLDGMQDTAKKQNKSVDEFIRDDLLPEIGRDMPQSLPETRNEKIDGDHATLEFKDKDDWKTAKFLKEGDSWKVAM